MPVSRSIIALLLVLLALTACAGSLKTSGKTTAAPTERLLVQPPNDWHNVYQVNVGDTRVADFVPAGESRDQWTAKLSFESYTKLLDSDPLTVIDNEISYEKKHCSFVRDFNLFSGMENNYEASTHLIICGKSTPSGKGEVTLFKAIKGTEYFYVIRMVRRLAPFSAEKTGFNNKTVAVWSHYFGNIKLCDPSSSDHPCPDASVKH